MDGFIGESLLGVIIVDEEREWEAENNPNFVLTKEEISQGWHFCPDWDEMLIGPDSCEMEDCTCNGRGDDYG